MSEKSKIKEFLKMQKQGIKFDDISKTLDLSSYKLRQILKNNNYISIKGKYELEVKQIELEINKNKKDTKLKSKTSSKKEESKTFKKTIKSEVNPITKNKLKQDKKINMSQNDMDKLCEMYDWYLQVKDLDIYTTLDNNKDIKLENKKLSDLKSTSIRVDRNIWDDFERLCANSNYAKQEIITQALKEFIRKYKHLL